MLSGALIALAALQPYAEYVHHDFEFPGQRAGWEAPLPEEVLQAMKVRHPDGELLVLTRQSAYQIDIAIKNPTQKLVPISTNAWPYLWLEAKLDGQWKPLEYFMPMCGNGAVTEFLDPGQSTASSFKYIPGPLKTLMRAALHIGDGNTVYSLPIDATLHKSMFSPAPTDGFDVEISMEYGIPMLKYTKRPIKPELFGLEK